MTTPDLGFDHGAFDYLAQGLGRQAKRFTKGVAFKALVSFPALIILFVLSLASLVLSSAQAPGEGFEVTTPRGPRGTVIPTPELVARCREVALALQAGGATSYEMLILTAIAGPESVGCHADALGDDYPIAGLLCPSHSWFQIRSCPDSPDPRRLNRGTREWLLMPINSARKALEILRGPQGLMAWTTYRNGSYLDWTEVALAATEGLR
jgi:hypothetical protein